MSSEGFEALRRRVHASPELAAALAAVAPERFREELVRCAGELGVPVEVADVERAIDAGIRAWTLRWVR
jgi:hypothetical protein